jgi:2-polyprenyl-3-methyl-5-hydroxy-6-metoxy-1,4-benzoquinol methylase
MAVAEAHAPVIAENGLKAGTSAAEQFQMQVLGHLTGAMTASLIGVGDRLGFYKALSKLGRATSAELASACGTHERFTREWLHQQACAGCVSGNAEATTFWLNPAQEAVLADEETSPFFSGGFFAMVPGMMGAAGGPLLDTFRSGLGFDYDAIGDDTLCGLCRALGVWPRHCLAERLAALPGMKEKLEAGIKIADVGCGLGEVLITLARAFPKCEFHGYDISARSLAAAQERIDKENNKPNITLHNPLEAGQGLPDAPTFDLIITMDAVHDMAHPDQVLPLVRKALKDDGAYIINDPKGLPTPALNIAENPAATMMFGFSCHCCLPSGMSDKNALGLGTLGFQEPVARKMAAAAGFTGFEVVDWQYDFNNVFVLKP